MKNIKTYQDVLLENFDKDEQRELDEDLIYNIRMNRLYKVEALLEQGADPNCMIDDDTPLSWAAQKSHVEIMAALLDAGADPNIEVRRMGRSISILCMAMSLGAPDLVYPMMELLLDAGVDPNGKDSFGRTPLAILAAMNDGNWDRYDLLFKYEADPNLADYDGHVPLHWPFKYMTGDDVDITKILILNGADPLRAVDDPQKILTLFDGDISWMPDGPLKMKLQRMQRGKSAFGM